MAGGVRIQTHLSRRKHSAPSTGLTWPAMKDELSFIECSMPGTELCVFMYLVYKFFDLYLLRSVLSPLTLGH